MRLYLLPDKRRSGRRKTHTMKKNLNPVYDQTSATFTLSSSCIFMLFYFVLYICVSVLLCRFEFSVSLVELHRRTLDVAVKNGGGLLSKHKGLLGKVRERRTHGHMTLLAGQL